MDNLTIDIKELHWMLDVLQSIDVGLIVLDLDGTVKVWNSFMENHSGKMPIKVIGRSLFDVFPNLPRHWIERKMETVTFLRSRAFSTWEQRPYLFRFKNYRPITGTADFMYQNITFIPIMAVDGTVGQVGIIIYDVTDIATNKMALESANETLSNLSRIDQLTQLFNRGYWEECLQREFTRYKRTKQTSSLVMFDIDYFKKVNDTYGHQAGDAVIRQTSCLLRSSARTTDICGRYGGEEFGVILIDTNAPNGHTFAERLRQTTQACAVQHEDRTIDYTISLGIAEINGDMKSHTQWIEAADMALYQAKHGGRNQSVVFSGC